MTRVLVVDDEPQIRRALRTSLEAHGYVVVTVGTGEEGVVGAAEQAPDPCCSTSVCPTSTAPR
jgi:two-component system KDP operon response regulator KdpE